MFKNIWNEINLQLTDTPSFIKKTFSRDPYSEPQLDQMAAQLEKTFGDPDKKLIFLIAPHGEGKTTFIHYVLQKNPHIASTYKSFIKIRDLDFAFLHLTSLPGRFCFIVLSLIFTYFLVTLLPPAGALPILLALGYFFAKNVANIIYVFYNTVNNLVTQREKLIIIEDLERSSLSTNDQWALVSNLWQNKRRYLISIGYPSDQKQEKLKIFEYIMKLKGTIIEINIPNEMKLEIAKGEFPELPFRSLPQKLKGKPNWLSLFTPQELLIVGEEVSLKAFESPDLAKQLTYVVFCLDWLTRKLELKKEEIFFDWQTREIRSLCYEDLPQEKRYYLESFIETIDPSLQIKFNLDDFKIPMVQVSHS